MTPQALAAVMAAQAAGAPVEVDAAVGKVARKVAATQAQLAPSRGGMRLLRSTLAAERVELGEWAVTTEAFYAHFVNDGTPTAAPRPFIEPSVDAHIDEFVDKVGDAGVF